jgi:hypothetical protein
VQEVMQAGAALCERVVADASPCIGSSRQAIFARFLSWFVKSLIWVPHVL